MRARWMGVGAGALVIAGAAAAALAWPADGAATAPPTLEELATRAVEDPDPAERSAAASALRSRGLEGYEALTRAHGPAIEALRLGRFEGDPTALREAVDRVSGQRDGHASGLYWHTDLAAAQRVARRTGRPILSLRLLGRLDEELSCANSRFFRVVLYSDPEVARALREQYVLHWSTERPAPRIEIDMGDGRRIVRTITGNSAHYVLDAEGRPIDVIVGLYAPAPFRSALSRGIARWRTCSGASDATACLADQHRDAAEAQRSRWARDGAQRGLPAWEQVLASMPDAAPSPAPSATRAMPMTMGKMFIEQPMLDLLQRAPAGAAAPPPEPDWARVVDARAITPPSEPTLALLRLKTGQADVAAMAARLVATAAEDGARNELLFHRRVHEWFALRAEGTDRFEALNARVYAELMLTPASDPWLGLRADDLYDGLEVER